MRKYLTPRELLRTLSTEQWVALATIVVAAAISCVGVTVTDYKNSTLYNTLIISTTVTIFFLTIVRYQFENEVMDRLTQFDSRSLVYEGDSVAGLAWIRKNSHGLKTVYNTVYRPDSADSPISLESEWIPYLAAIRNAISQGCIWFDLQSPSPAAASRSLIEFRDSLTEEERKRYRPKVLPTGDAPLLQITILKYSNGGPSKMSLGYGFPGVKDTMVFTSSNPETIKFFEDYFFAVYNSSRAENLPAPTVPAPARKSIFSFFGQGRNAGPEHT